MKKLIYSTLVAAAVAVALAFVGCANETVDMLPSRGETPPVTGPSAESVATELTGKLGELVASGSLTVGNVTVAKSLVDQIDLDGVSAEVAEKLAEVATNVANKAIEAAGDKLADKKTELETALNAATSPQAKVDAAQKALAAVEEAVKEEGGSEPVDPPVEGELPDIQNWGLIPLDYARYELKDMKKTGDKTYEVTIKADDVPAGTPPALYGLSEGHYVGIGIPKGKLVDNGDIRAKVNNKDTVSESDWKAPMTDSNFDKKGGKDYWMVYWDLDQYNSGCFAIKDRYTVKVTFECTKAPKKVTTGLPEFAPATLADSIISGSAKYKLYEPNSYKLTDMYYMDNDKNTYYVTVNANKLKKHKNGAHTEGYWIGIGIPKEVCTIGDAYEVGWKDGQTQKGSIKSDNDFDTAKKLDGQGFATDDWDTKKYLTYWWSWTSNSQEGIFKVGAKTVIVKFNVTNPVDRISIDPKTWGMEAVDKSNGNPSLSNMYYYSDDPTTYYLTLTARNVVKKPAGGTGPIAAWVGVKIPIGEYAPKDGSRTTPNGCWLNKDGTFNSPLKWKPNTDADFENNGYYYCYWRGEYGNGYDGYFGMKDSSGKIIYIVRVAFDVTVAN